MSEAILTIYLKSTFEIFHQRMIIVIIIVISGSFTDMSFFFNLDARLLCHGQFFYLLYLSFNIKPFIFYFFYFCCYFKFLLLLLWLLRLLYLNLHFLHLHFFHLHFLDISIIENFHNRQLYTFNLSNFWSNLFLLFSRYFRLVIICCKII